MDKTKRTTVTMDILDWLEEDTKKELRDEERKKYANLRAEYIKMKSVAVSEMYRAIEDINDNRDNCFLALGKAHLCYRLGLISKKAYCEIHDYLKRKTRDQNDWKALGISRSHTYAPMRSKGFPTLTIGKRMTVPKDKLKEWMDKHTAA